MGNVGAGVFKHLTQNRALLRERLGFELDVTKIALRNPGKDRGVAVPPEIVTTQWQDILDDSSIQIVVELMGQKEESLRFMLGAIQRGKIVVTGNKALLAEHGREIFEAATRHKVPVFFEAAVAGGIPIIKSIREAFIGNHIRSIHGIINGTSNYILTAWWRAGWASPRRLAEAQAAGYAEADPTLDVNGWDAAHKAVILASLAYGFWVSTDKIFRRGHRAQSPPTTFPSPKSSATPSSSSASSRPMPGARSRCACIPRSSPRSTSSPASTASSMRSPCMAISSATTLFYGRGAGQDPTSSSVIADLAEAAAALQAPRSNYGFMPHGLYGTCTPIDDIVSEYYLRLTVEDRPGVIAQVAGILGGLNIGISSIFQPEGDEGAAVPLILVLHKADARPDAALEQIGALECVKKTPRMIRVENFA